MILQLASKSPRRRELLDQIGVEHKVISVNVPEAHRPGEPPLAYVTRLAQSKALAGVSASPSLPTLGADTIVCCDEGILEKPQDKDDFQRMMQLLSGRTHQVITAVALTDGEITRVDHSTSDVSFRNIREHEIEDYWRSGEPHDKAGGYAIQGLGAVFVTAIKGSYSGVVGLPIETLCPLLSAFNVPVWTHKKT